MNYLFIYCCDRSLFIYLFIFNYRKVGLPLQTIINLICLSLIISIQIFFFINLKEVTFKFVYFLQPFLLVLNKKLDISLQEQSLLQSHSNQYLYIKLKVETSWEKI